MSERNSFDVNLQSEDQIVEYDQWLADRDQEFLEYLEAFDEDEGYPEDDYDYDDGQPDEYTEWQDYMGGDDWDHGQYDDCPW